jgi:magnesium transporter
MTRQLVIVSHDGDCTQTADLSRIPQLLGDPRTVFWLDIEQPEAEDIDFLQNVMSFHPLAIEDATHRQHRPKIDSYEKYYFFIFYAIALGRYAHEQAEEELRVRQVSVFAGQNYLITIHRRYIPEVAETMRRWQANRDVIGVSAGAIAYALLDALVDNYFPVVDELADRVEDLEEQIFENYREEAIAQIFSVKKDLLNLRRVISPSRDVLNIMLRQETVIFDTKTILYLTDVYDHIVRVTDSLDTYRDLLSSALDGYLSMASNRMNQTMRVLTSSSIILMTMALVAGIYGMNFEHMPELKWSLGYVWAILLMGGLGLGMAFFFKRKGWF